MMICPQCKAEIDNDSWFCDQCGTEIYVCPSCHVIGKGKGKRCGKCGSPLVAASSLSVSPIPPKRQQDISNEQQPQHNSQQVQVPSPQGIDNTTKDTGIPQPTSLWCMKENIRIPLSDNAIIGRTEGCYCHLLSTFKYVSRTHARLNKVGNQWSITDLGSRNGTRVNGTPCSPSLDFRYGDIIRIANYYDFKVE